MVQYADDTLLLIRADIADATRLKELLDAFANTIGLRIDFTKSTFMPMHVPEELLPDMISVLYCRVEGFPQTYLGLPLSNIKLPLSAFAPVVSSSGRYLSGWQSRLLNMAGRSELVTSVLDSLPTYFMAAMLLPTGTIDQLEQDRRSFFWAGSDSVSGAQCLVA